MNGTELVAEVRLKLRDTASPSLWTDAAIYSYLNQSYQYFAEKTHILQDFDCYSVQTSIGVNRYPLETEILSVLTAQNSTLSTTCDMNRLQKPMTYVYSSVTGAPTQFATIAGKPVYLLVHPVPDKVYTIKLGVAKRPTDKIVAGVTPDIPEEYHLDLAYGAAIRCLEHMDADGFEPQLLDKYEERWYTCLRNTKREVYRLLNSHNTLATASNWTGRVR